MSSSSSESSPSDDPSPNPTNPTPTEIPTNVSMEPESTSLPETSPMVEEEAAAGTEPSPPPVAEEAVAGTEPSPPPVPEEAAADTEPPPPPAEMPTSEVGHESSPASKPQRKRGRPKKEEHSSMADGVSSPLADFAPPLAVMPLSEVMPESTPRTKPQNKRGRAKKDEGSAVSDEAQERPDWLPEGWKIETKVRVKGKTAGLIDKSYHNPEGLMFRSRKEVLYYLEHGEQRPGSVRKPSNKKTKTDSMPLESSASSCLESNNPPQDVNVQGNSTNSDMEHDTEAEPAEVNAQLNSTK